VTWASPRDSGVDQGLAPQGKRAASTKLNFEILCLEDDPNDQALIKYAFRKTEVHLRFFEDCSELLDYLQGRAGVRQPPPDLVLLDIYLPGGNGLQMLSWLKHHPAFARIPVIVATGSIVPADRERAQALGATAVFEKDISFQPLVQLVSQILSRKQGTSPHRRRARKTANVAVPVLQEAAKDQLELSL
jgi:CheY-like chemotaxis protein